MDISDGVAVTFTGPQSEVDQLREEVRDMADANNNEGNPFAGCPCAGNHARGSAQAMPKGSNAENDRKNGGRSDGSPGSASMQSPSGNLLAHAKVEEISTGAVLELSAKDKGQVQPLRSEVRSAVKSMRNNGCLGPK
jgi:hypothetical protein